MLTLVLALLIYSFEREEILGTRLIMTMIYLLNHIFMDLFGIFFASEFNVLNDMFKQKRDSLLVIFQLELPILFGNIDYGKVYTTKAKRQRYPSINQSRGENGSYDCTP